MPISHVWYRYSQQINMVHSVLPSDARITSFSHRLYMCAVYILCAVLCVIAFLYCLVRVGGVNRIGDKTRQFCLIFTQFPICNCSVSNILRTTGNLMEIGNWVETRQNCLVLSPVVFTPSTRTRPDSLVLSCPCRRCELAITPTCCVTYG